MTTKDRRCVSTVASNSVRAVAGRKFRIMISPYFSLKHNKVEDLALERMNCFIMKQLEYDRRQICSERG